MAVKFRKPDSPAFNPGEVWFSACKRSRVVIISTERYHTDKWSVTVNYKDDFTERDKNAWDFQVRYSHQSDFKQTNKI